MNDLSFLVVPLPEEIRKEIALGNLRTAEMMIRREMKKAPKLLKLRLEYEIERIRRMEKDYPHNREKALELLKRRIENFKEEELALWLSEGIVDKHIFEGEERFYDRFVDNIFFLKPGLRRRDMKDSSERKYTKRLIAGAMVRINKGEVRKYRVKAGIRIKLKKQGYYRVWLPFPKENFQVEKVKLLRATGGKYYVAENDAFQRTIYFEGKNKEFGVEFEYVISEVNGAIEGEADLGQNMKEKLPHVRFTPYIKELAQKIVGDEKDDYSRARKIYEWITGHTTYTYVREYCMYDNISEYVATSLRGDCGMFALLFITLCRALGIPAKWQSGWFITPKFASPHDWAQVYVNDAWLPVDASFGNARRHGSRRNEFYFGNLDAFRMIANDDFLVDFEPEKRFWRSDPVDNQRGEVENERRNIYFNEFSTDIYVKEFHRV